MNDFDPTDILREHAEMVAFANAQLPAGIQDMVGEQTALLKDARSLLADLPNRFLPPLRSRSDELREVVEEVIAEVFYYEPDQPRPEAGYHLRDRHNND